MKHVDAEHEAAARTADPVPSGAGRYLDTATRAPLERRLGHDLSRVRIHADAPAAAAADALRADAFTVGDHIAFGAGRFAPGTAAGDRLLAHELAHVVQQRFRPGAGRADATRAEAEADAVAGGAPASLLSHRPVALHLQPVEQQQRPSPPPQQPPPAGITRPELATRLKALLGHDVTITIGDRARQTRELGGPVAKRRLPDTWQSWDPGATATLYEEIVTAFTDVQREVGGLPDITEIVFYDMHYGWDENDNVVADTEAAASIRGRVMNIYRASLFPTQAAAGGSGLQISGIPLAKGRSTKKAKAAMGIGTRAESQRRAVAHELGHGIERRTGALREFEKAVGWSRATAPPKLYDIKAKGVRKAIDDDKEPPAKALITKQNWNSGALGEQPLRAYAVQDPAEDFADSLMAWIYARDVLKLRSPARFKYFDDQSRRSGWLQKLVLSQTAAPTSTPPPSPPPTQTQEGR